MKRVLFVDDESQILQGLQRSLRPRRNEWKMAFVEGGEQALALLASEPFDVVVTDMKMPGMDGATLLERVRELYPHMGRIVLSGHTEVESALHAVRVAHQFLMKPCEAETFCAAIKRTCDLQGVLSSENLAQVVGEIGELPSAPQTYSLFVQALTDPKCSLDYLGTIIERDVGISAKMLQLVNSAFFGLSDHISSVRRAVGYLGLDILQGLVASAEAFRAFEGARRLTRFSIDEFERHAQLTARIAGTFALPRAEAESAVAGALLHDVGKLVLAARMPERFQESLHISQERHCGLHDIESESYGVTHAEIGAYLLVLWGPPTSITQAVAYHHAPLRVAPEGIDAVVAVYLSNLLAHELEGNTIYAETALQELGLIEQYPRFQERARSVVAA